MCEAEDVGSQVGDCVEGFRGGAGCWEEDEVGG